MIKGLPFTRPEWWPPLIGVQECPWTRSECRREKLARLP